MFLFDAVLLKLFSLGVLRGYRPLHSIFGVGEADFSLLKTKHLNGAVRRLNQDIGASFSHWPEAM